MMKKRILILSYSNLETDPRVKRQIRALKDSYALTTVAYSPGHDRNHVFESIYSTPSFSLTRKGKRFFQLITGQFDRYYWDDQRKHLLQKFQHEDYRLIIANDIPTLPLALAIGRQKSKVYFDAHEYHPREWEDNWKWNLLNKKYIEYLCLKYIPQADAFSTVSESIAAEYGKFTGIKPIVITNATRFHDLCPSVVEDNHIRIIHHGAAIPSRKIEIMIETARQLNNRFSVDFMLTGNPSYINRLKRLSAACKQINFIPPVPEDRICERLNQYDIGLYILPPTNFNNLYALPNKFFEFIQARLCLAVSPNPEMASMVKTYRLGIVSKDFTPESMAAEINKLSKEEIVGYKLNSHLHSRTLSFEENLKIINAIVKKLVG